MGKVKSQRREKVGPPSCSSSSTLSIREQASGKKQTHNSKSLLKHKHLQNLATLFVVNDDFAPSLGAFFGRRFAHFGDSLGISHHPSLFPCQRCETILQPGSNCTVRIEKNRAKHKKHNKTKTDTQNNIVYTCHFCLHRNLKQGTPKGYMKDLVPSKSSSSNSKSVNITMEKSNLSNVHNEKKIEPLPAVIKACSYTDSPSLSVKSDGKLLDSKRRKRKKPEVKELAEDKVFSSAPREREQASGTSKRKRKTWTSLKDIAESEKRDRNQRFKNFSIPFVL